MRAIPDVQAKRSSKCASACSARISEAPKADASDYRRNIGRTSDDFQCRLPIVNGLFVIEARFKRSFAPGRRIKQDGGTWQQPVERDRFALYRGVL
jgi:hypothetical protein